MPVYVFQLYREPSFNYLRHSKIAGELFLMVFYFSRSLSVKNTCIANVERAAYILRRVAPYVRSNYGTLVYLKNFQYSSYINMHQLSYY